MDNIRWTSLGALLLVGMLIVTACVRNSAPDAANKAVTPVEHNVSDAAKALRKNADEPVTLTWAFWGNPEERASHERIATVFMQEHPSITIDIWNQPWNEYTTKLKTLWVGGDPTQIPDVLFLWPTPSYAATGVLENLTPYIEQHNYDLSDYWPALLESAMYRGDIYGLPRDISVEVLYYNKTIFDEVGLPYPTEQWTWDDLLSAAQKLTMIEANGRVKRYALAMEGGKYGLWVNQNKGGILDDMRNPTACTLSAPSALEAITFFAEMMNAKLAMRDADLNQAGGDTAVFQSGQAAMIIQNSSRVSAFNQAGLSYDVVPIPVPKGGQRAASAGGAAWVISAESDNKAAAWTFLQWLQSSTGGEKLYTKAGEIFPALRSVATSDAFLKMEQPPANRQAFLIEGEHAQVGRFGYFSDWDELNSSIIEAMLQRVWAGEATSAETMPQLCKQVDAFLQAKNYPH